MSLAFAALGNPKWTAKKIDVGEMEIYAYAGLWESCSEFGDQKSCEANRDLDIDEKSKSKKEKEKTNESKKLFCPTPPPVINNDKSLRDHPILNPYRFQISAVPPTH